MLQHAYEAAVLAELSRLLEDGGGSSARAKELDLGHDDQAKARAEQNSQPRCPRAEVALLGDGHEEPGVTREGTPES